MSWLQVTEDIARLADACERIARALERAQGVEPPSSDEALRREAEAYDAAHLAEEEERLSKLFGTWGTT